MDRLKASMHASAMNEPVIGILMLDHVLTRPPGDPGNPATFPFPVIYATVPGVTLERLLDADPGILAPLTQAAQDLVQSGAAAITSGCGFFIYFQEDLSLRLQVPVLLSSLLQIPFIQKAIGPHKRIGILTAHSGCLSLDHLLKTGMDPCRRAKVIGMETETHFIQGVLTNQGFYDFSGIEKEVVAKAEALVQTDDGGSPVGAILLECTNLPPFAAAIQEATELPVFDITTLVSYLRQSLTRSRFS